MKQHNTHYLELNLLHTTTANSICVKIKGHLAKRCPYDCLSYSTNCTVRVIKVTRMSHFVDLVYCLISLNNRVEISKLKPLKFFKDFKISVIVKPKNPNRHRRFPLLYPLRRKSRNRRRSRDFRRHLEQVKQ